MALRNNIASRKGGFTLVELLVAVMIAVMVTAVCMESFIALQRGFGYCTTWMEVRNNQVRLIDTLAQDLRSNVSSTISTTLPLTLTVPRRYSTYETSGPFAGEPGRSATRIDPAISSSSGKVDYTTSGTTMTVVYSMTTTGSSSEIFRTVTWSGGTATRSVAEFTNGVTIKFTKTTVNSATSVATTVAAKFGTKLQNGRPDFVKTMSDTVYLRNL